MNFLFLKIQNLDRKDTIQSVPHFGQYKGRFSVIRGGEECHMLNVVR